MTDDLPVHAANPIGKALRAIQGADFATVRYCETNQEDYLGVAHHHARVLTEALAEEINQRAAKKARRA